MNVLQSIVQFISDWPYLIKASSILCLLYIPYHYLFAKDASFHINRIYLLSAMALTWVLPIIRIDVFPIWLKIRNDVSNTTLDLPKSGVTFSEIIFTLIMIVYILVAFWLLYKLWKNITNILTIKENATQVPHENYTLVIGTLYPISSFFRYIFLPSESTNKMLIEHELIHVNQRHSIDIIVSEVFKCIFWFHPLAYALHRSIRLNHEYECDAKMSYRYSYESYGKLFLIQSQSLSKNFIINHFYSFTKKRIAMMSQQKNNPSRSFRSLLMLPTLLTVFVFFSFKTYYIPSQYPDLQTINPDTIPSNDIMDTIITMDPVSYAQKVQIVKRKKTDQMDEAEILKLYPEIITQSDTSFTLDPKTYKETMVISTTKMKKGYYLLINAERSKANPNNELIEKWIKEGTIN